MELRHLRYFVAVAEEENVSRAASKLHVSQPGVSRQIHDLENEIGFPLFERTGKSVRLTVAGRIFFAEARDLLARTAAAVERARASLTSQAEINVGYIPSGTVEILPRALRLFRGRFPTVHVTLHDLSAEDMPPLLLQKKLDLALTVLRHKLPRELAMQELARYETCVGGRKDAPAGKVKVRPPRQMASEPVATYTRKDYPGYNKHLEKLFATVGRKPRVGSEHDSGSSLIAAVAAGHEFAILPSCVRGAAGTRLKFLEAASRAAAVVHRRALAQGRRDRAGERLSSPPSRANCKVTAKPARLRQGSLLCRGRLGHPPPLALTHKRKTL